MQGFDAKRLRIGLCIAFAGLIAKPLVDENLGLAFGGGLAVVFVLFGIYFGTTRMFER